MRLTKGILDLAAGFGYISPLFERGLRKGNVVMRMMLTSVVVVVLALVVSCGKDKAAQTGPYCSGDVVKSYNKLLAQLGAASSKDKLSEVLKSAKAEQGKYPDVKCTIKPPAGVADTQSKIVKHSDLIGMLIKKIEAKLAAVRSTGEEDF